MQHDSFSDPAKRVLDFLYRYWADNRRPPSVADIHGATGFELPEIRRTFRELQEGFALVFSDGMLNLNLQKVTPFSATPTPVHVEHEGSFLSYVGCPAEAITLTAMPMFAKSVVTVKSWCGCCYQPITLDIENMKILTTSAPGLLVSMVGSPYEWEYGVPADRVCDSIHFVVDQAHADRYEQQICRRGVTLTLDQIGALGASAGRSRMWDPDWPPMRFDGRALVDGLAAMGVDVSAWRPTFGNPS